MRVEMFTLLLSPFSLLTWLSTYCSHWLLVKSVDVMPQKEIYLPDYRYYHNLSTVEKDLKDIVSENSKYMRIDWNYKSRDKRPQMLLHVTNFSQSLSHYFKENVKYPKVTVLLSYGEHAREFLPVESMFHLLNNLTTGLHAPHGSFEEIYSRNILSKLDLYIIAMANPDGRHYVEQSRNYCWRGTASGVDLNRNFDWEFAKRGSSSDPADEEYHGPSALSEAECLVYTQLTKHKSFDVFLSFHSGIRQIYLPFADTRSKATNRQPENIKKLTELASLLATSTKHRYSFGKAYDLTFYTADGTSFDYMAGVRKVPFSLAVELWGNSEHRGPSCFDQFNPHSKIVQREVIDLHPLYVALFFYVIQWKESWVLLNPDNVKDPSSFSLNFILFGGIVVIMIILAAQRKSSFCKWWYHRKQVISVRNLSSAVSRWGIIKSV